MNKFNKGVLAAAVLGTSVLSSAAMAAQKIGVVNVQGIFQSLPQAAVIQENIRNEFKDQIEEIGRMEKDIKYYMEKRERDAATMSEAELKELEGKLISLRDEYTSKTQPLQQQIQARQGEERDKLLGLIKQAIDGVAEKGNYDLVLNSNAVAYMAEADNLSQQVVDQVSKIK